MHAQGARPAGGKGEAAFWVPLLALHSGARREELCQLLVSDIKERDGIPFLSLSVEDELGQRHDTKALKNLGSHARAPESDSDKTAAALKGKLSRSPAHADGTRGHV